MREYTGSIRAMCRMTGENISPYFFPFLLGDYIVATGLSKILILLIFIIIVCNVFCKQEEIYYYAIRTGYRVMVYGDILFIGILALGYCMYVYLCSILCFLPYVTIQGDWGRIIGTLAYTNAAGQYGYMFVIPTGIMEMYSAPNGVLLSFVLLFASCFFIHEIRQYIWAYWEKRLGQNCADEVHMRGAAANLRTDSDGWKIFGRRGAFIRGLWNHHWKPGISAPLFRAEKSENAGNDQRKVR